MRRMLLEWNTIRKQSANRAQALVEFSLTLLVFLLLMFMIVEIGHLMFSWIIVNNASRAGARYAITGEYMPLYGEDPMHGWNLNTDTGDPLDNIPPCWPLFSDDDVLLVRGEAPDTTQLFQHYRNARTCSVEDETLHAMRGLSLNTGATFYEPGYYDVQVMAVNDPVLSDTEITRYFPDNSANPLKTSFPEETDDAQDVAGGNAINLGTGGDPIYLGYAGRPQEFVIVRVYYRKPILTPVLNSIVDSIMLVGTSQMTNEAFGSTGVQREAILPPELPDVPTPGPLGPPDIVPTGFTMLSSPSMPMNPSLDYPLDFRVTMENQGEKDVLAGFPFLVELVIVPEADAAAMNIPDVSETDVWPGTAVSLGTYTLDELLSGYVKAEDITMTLTAGALTDGTYRVYAYLDSSNQINEAGLSGSPEYNVARERNNIIRMDSDLVVGAAADIEVEITPDDDTPATGETLVYTVRVNNLSTLYPSSGVEINFTLDPGLELLTVSDTTNCTFTPGDAEPVDCVLPAAIPATGSYSIQIAVQPNDPYATLSAAAVVSATTPDPDLTNNAALETLLMDAIDIEVTKSIQGAPANLTPGDIITFVIDVDNLEDNASGEVIITDVLSDSYDYQAGTDSATAGSVVFDSPSNTVTWTIPANVSAGGEQLTFDVEVVSPDNPDNTVTSSFTPPDVDPTNDSDTVSPLISEVDLRLYKYVSDTTVAPGQVIQYRFEASVRSGDPDAVGVVISDVLPAGMTHYTGSPPAGISTCTPTVSPSAYDGGYNAGSDEWTVSGDLAAGITVTFTICAEVDSAAVAGTSIDNTAVISANQFDPAVGNNDRDPGSANPLATVLVSRDTDLAVTAVVSVGGSPVTSVRAGDNVTLTLTVTNDAGSLATPTDVALSNGISAALAAAFDGTPTITASQGTFNAGTQAWSIGTLAPGDTATATVSGTIGTIAVDTDAGFTPTVSATGINDTDSSNDSVTVLLTLSSDTSMVDEDFSDDTPGPFNYSDDPSWNKTSSSGTHAEGQVNSGTICVNLGYSGADDVSGGYTTTFTISSDTYALLSFDYRITAASQYENYEYIEAWAWIDGTFLGSSIGSDNVAYVDRITGAYVTDTGWRSYSDSFPLSAGTHTLILGGYNNDSTQNSEIGSVCFDNVSMVDTAPPFYTSGFDSDSDGWSYHDNPFDYQGDFGNDAYANGRWNSGDGYTGGGLRIQLSGDSRDASGAFERTFTLTETRDLQFTFNYNIQENRADNGEEAWLLVRLNGTYYGTGSGFYATNYVDQVNNGSTGWKSATVDFGTLPPGTYTIEIGGYMDRLNRDNEDYFIYLDDFLID